MLIPESFGRVSLLVITSLSKFDSFSSFDNKVVVSVYCPVILGSLRNRSNSSELSLLQRLVYVSSVGFVETTLRQKSVIGFVTNIGAIGICEVALSSFDMLVNSAVI